MHPFLAAFGDELVKVGAAKPLASRLTPESSNVRGYSYDAGSKALTVTYKSGGTYRYDGVPPNVAKALSRNKSVGQTINRMVKAPGYTYEKVGEDKTYATKLSPKEESAFQGWVKTKKVPFDPSPKADYDMRGYWKAQQGGDARATTAVNEADRQMHFPDTWKTPYHKTFSNESIYAPKDAPSWQGNKLVDKTGKVIADETPRQVTPAPPMRTRSPTPPRPRPLEKKSEDLRSEVAKALLHRRLRGRAVRDIGVKSMLRERIREGNVLAPVSGVIDTMKKHAGAKSLLHEIRESPLTEAAVDELLQRGVDYIVHHETPERPHHHHRKHASGDMLQYFQDHPEKLKAKLERDRKKKPRKGGSWNGTKNHWSKQASATIEYFTESRRWAMKLAGVAKKQATIFGLRVKIEHEPGDVRSGTSKDGKTWERKMYASYGYVPGTKGKGDDGDAIDVYVADDPQDGPVFEIDQEKKDGGHDEMKYMVGYPDMESAKADYMRHMPEWAFGSIKQVAESAKDFAEQWK